jgi:hypothetical protein
MLQVEEGIGDQVARFESLRQPELTVSALAKQQLIIVPLSLDFKHVDKQIHRNYYGAGAEHNSQRSPVS